MIQGKLQWKKCPDSHLAVLFMLLLLLGSACDRYPGYAKGKNGIYYQLQKIGEDTVKIKPGNYVTADLAYMTLEDSVFFRGTRKFQVTSPDFQGAVDECFMMLARGDCAVFIIPAEDFFRRTLQSDLPAFISKEKRMKLMADILDVQTESQYQQEKEVFLNWIKDFGDYERILLQQYIADEKLDASPQPSGIYYFPMRQGNGKKVKIGDTVQVHYEGRFLDGKFFDSTVRRNQPFTFVFGTEWQVIKGLEEAIGMMSEGEKSLFIVPSDMAFGQTGSATGIIPPYTSLIFEVELLSVSSRGKI